MLERWRASIASGQAFEMEFPLRGADGRFRQFLTRAFPLKDAKGRVLQWFGTNTDVDELKLSEEALARLAAIVEWSEDAILSKALDGRIQTWNAGAERMFGYRAEEVIGQPVTILLPPERVEEEGQVLERLKRGESVAHYETVRVTKDGRRLDVSLTISPVKDIQGRVVGASKIVRDIGEVVQARQVLAQSKEELERLVDERTAKLRETMAELEHMSYSMIHDMRAPLRAMQTFATLAEQDCAGCLRPQGADYFRRIRDSSNRLDRLITDALSYNQVVRQDLPVTPVEIGRLLRSMLDTYPNLLPSVADIAIEFNELVVLGNESLLTQCFSNLLGNAIKFVAPGVRPRIRVWAEAGGAVERQSVGALEREASQPSNLPAPQPSLHHSTTPPLRLPLFGFGLKTTASGFQKMRKRISSRMFQRMFGQRGGIPRDRHRVGHRAESRRADGRAHGVRGARKRKQVLD